MDENVAWLEISMASTMTRVEHDELVIDGDDQPIKVLGVQMNLVLDEPLNGCPIVTSDIPGALRPEFAVENRPSEGAFLPTRVLLDSCGGEEFVNSPIL